MSNYPCVNCYRVLSNPRSLPRSLGLRTTLHRTLYANHRPGPALSRPAPSCSLEPPRILHQNGNTAVTVTTAHHRRFASKWGPKGKQPQKKPAHPYKWASPPVSNEVYSLLESQILDSTLFASERFPAMPAILDSDPKRRIAKAHIAKTLNPHNSENETPPDDDDESPPRTTYDALAIDCEMVAMAGGEQGLVNIAVVDFFTGKVVLRSLVRPGGPVTDWRKGVTRLNKAMLNEAAKKGKVIGGWEKVRQRIFSVSNSKTIFIGHALANDLRVLRIATDRVVDSMMMMSRAVYGDMAKFPRNWGLKTACDELLGVTVQKTSGPHNPLEDALATREIVLLSVLNPHKLTEWGAHARAGLAHIAQKERDKADKKKEKHLARLERKKQKKAENARKSPQQRAEEATERQKKIAERQRKKAAEREARIQKRRLAKIYSKVKRQLKKEREYPPPMDIMT
ncbi:ribonuclease H-like domain-containing protein [Xylaria sp. FL1777]|nr:ribonuclease H-like domain-containing protein [Xylaria sp. FL1777]